MRGSTARRARTAAGRARLRGRAEAAPGRPADPERQPTGLRVLFVAAEMAPFMKVGGLADVVQGLPAALRTSGHDVRVLMPAYTDVQHGAAVENYRAPEGCDDTRLFETSAPECDVPIWMLDAAGFRDRPGNPYVDARGQPYPDDALRFGQLGRVGAAMAADACGLGWRPDVVHVHDWHAGLVPVWMLLRRAPAAVVFTIHNLAHQGLFPRTTLAALGLPAWLWHYEALEFYGRLSFMKGGLVFSDHLTTVSPAYAKEILTEIGGCGLGGLLSARAKDLTGILNGIDTAQWDPATDSFLDLHYSARNPRPRRALKRSLQQAFGLPVRKDVPLIGFIGRLVNQKGIDVLIEALPGLMRLPVQLVALGSGEQKYEQALAGAVQSWPEQLAVRVAFDEALAHRMYAGLDMLLMPSRFEPCGLGQLYAMRYGTIPVVHTVGGLADTVVDADEKNLEAGTANGLGFAPLEATALSYAVERAASIYRQHPDTWRSLVQAAMECDFSWNASARRYEAVYAEVLLARTRGPMVPPKL